MARVFKWIGYGLGGLLALAALVVVIVYGASEVMLRRPHEKPASHLTAANGAGAADRGRRIATVWGCVSCHGESLQGQMFDDLPGIARLYAPNLTLVAARDSDADLDRAIRRGVATDGHALWVMPSAAFAHMTDAETADLIAYLRTKAPAGPPQPRPQFGPIGRLGALIGQFKPEIAVIAAHENPPLADLGPRYAQGRALARACVECHGPALQGGSAPIVSPDLAIAAAYDPSDFRTLMRTGKAAGGRELKMMSPTARQRFAGLSDDEIAALQAYLKARADRQAGVEDGNILSKP